MLKGILTEGQMKRHRQILLQVEAPRSLTDPKVVETLGLRESQLEAIHGTLESFRPEPGSPPPPRKELIAKVISHLDQAQLAKWKEMTGKEFKLPERPRR